MPATPTPRLGLPRPDGGDADYPPADFEALTDALDDIVAVDDQGLFADRPPATASRRGVYYYATDADAHFRCTGTAWKIVHAKPIIASGTAQISTTNDDGTPYPAAAAVAPVTGIYDITAEISIYTTLNPGGTFADGVASLLGVPETNSGIVSAAPTAAGTTLFAQGTRSMRVQLAKGTTVMPQLLFVGNGKVTLMWATVRLALVEA